MRHSLDDVFYGIEALKTRYDPVEEECFDDPSTPKESVDYEALDKGMEALEFEAEAIQTKADLVLTCMEEMTAYQDYIRRNGIDRASLSLLNRNNRFSRYLNVTLPACESMTTVGSPYSELSLVCMEGIGKTLKKFGKVLWKTIKAVFKWITTPFRALWKKIREAWKETEDSGHLGTKEDIKKTIKALVDATKTVISKHSKKKFDEGKFKDEVKGDLKEVLGEKMYYVKDEATNTQLSKDVGDATKTANDSLTTIETEINKIDHTSTAYSLDTSNNTINNYASGGSTTIKKLLAKDSAWNDEKTKITTSNPDVSNLVLLNIHVKKADFDSQDKQLQNFINKATEFSKKIDSFISANNAAPSGTGNPLQNQQSTGTTTSLKNKKDETERLSELKTTITGIQKVATFISTCYTGTVSNAAVNAKYSSRIEKILKDVISEYELTGVDADQTLNELKSEYKKRISFVFNDSAPTPEQAA